MTDQARMDVMLHSIDLCVREVGRPRWWKSFQAGAYNPGGRVGAQLPASFLDAAHDRSMCKKRC